MLALSLYVSLVFLTLDCVKLFLLTSNLSLEVSTLFCLSFLNLGSIFSLFFDSFHHCNLLSFHLSDFLLHLLCLELLLIQCLCQLCLFLLLFLKILKLQLHLSLFLFEVLFNPAFLCIASALLQRLCLFSFKSTHLINHARNLLVVLFTHFLKESILHFLLLLFDRLKQRLFLLHLFIKVLLFLLKRVDLIEHIFHLFCSLFVGLTYIRLLFIRNHAV